MFHFQTSKLQNINFYTKTIEIQVHAAINVNSKDPGNRGIPSNCNTEHSSRARRHSRHVMPAQAASTLSTICSNPRISRKADLILKYRQDLVQTSACIHRAALLVVDTRTGCGCHAISTLISLPSFSTLILLTQHSHHVDNSAILSKTS